MTAEIAPISMRPHHVMCTLGFQGAGYSPPFIRNYQEIKGRLTKDPKMVLVITAGMDAICAPCPHNQGAGICEKEALIQSLDQRHLEALELSLGQTLSWTEARALIKDKMTLEKFHAACAGCAWKAWGVCQTALEKERRL